jgi:hypothetical protein
MTFARHEQRMNGHDLRASRLHVLAAATIGDDEDSKCNGNGVP